MTMINKCSLVLLNYGAILIVSKVYIDRSNVAFKLWCDINCHRSNVIHFRNPSVH